MTTAQQRPANARPTKAFFTGMLTRDIELKDAVLDLLDNCVDGLMRSLRGKTPNNPRKPYEGYRASVSFASDEFSIEDNCGGISKQVAQDSAFRLGRTDVDRGRDGALQTVGTYGVGMKRAIFKIGRSCEVQSVTARESFKVTISKVWFEDDADWYLPLQNVRPWGKSQGVRIVVRDLLPPVAREFFPLRNFGVEFSKVVAEQFALIISKGFEVVVDGTKVKPKTFRFRSVDLSTYAGGIAPFLFRADDEGVYVDLSVGFYKPVPDDGDLDEEDADAGTSTADEAGWTIICNDRVVLSHDKSVVTGWGTSGVPQYHNQFISIAGTVKFTSSDASKLPLTTTKRGVDLNNELYLRVRDKMIEGTKFFTSYTNKIKKIPKERKEALFNEIGSVELKDLDSVATSASLQWKRDRTLNGKTFRPELPELNSSRLKVVRFSRSIEEIEEVREFLFGDEMTTAAEVGAASFDQILKAARKS